LLKVATLSVAFAAESFDTVPPFWVAENPGAVPPAENPAAGDVELTPAGIVTG